MPRSVKKTAKYESIQKEKIIKLKLTAINLQLFISFFIIIISYIFYYLYSKGFAESIIEKSPLPPASLDHDYVIFFFNIYVFFLENMGVLSSSIIFWTTYTTSFIIFIWPYLV